METIFLSYARADATFALRLAEDIRNSGTGVWIDQASIKAGNRWDASIEAALITASRLIIVLSPAAVASNNVMDEVSFALENRKTIIPVLMAECATPFRLRRLQRIDFTGDYRGGLRKLLEALSEPATDDDQEATDAGKQKINEGGNRWLSKKYFWVGTCLLLAVITIWMLVNNAQNKSAEANGWKTALNKNDSASYSIYLNNFPSGLHREQAIKKIDSITAAPLKVVTTPLRDSIAGNKSHGSISYDSTKPPRSKNKMKVPVVENNAAVTPKTIAPKPEMGKPYQGGIVYFVDSTGKHGLIVAEKEIIIYNDDNTENRTFTYEQSKKVCSDLVLKGYSDWYLPGKTEFIKLYRAREMLPNIGLINSYWSSTEVDNTQAWLVRSDGGTFPSYKFSHYPIRAVRAF